MTASGPLTLGLALATFALSGLALASGSAGGVSVLVVDDDGGPGVAYTDLQPAIDAAKSGDVVLVKAGSYDGFDLDGLGIVITADLGADVNVEGGISVKNLPFGEDAALCGLSVHELGSSPFHAANNLGAVYVQDCSFASDGIALFTPHSPPAVVTDCMAISFVDCVFYPTSMSGMPGGALVIGMPGLEAVDSRVNLYGCSLYGIPGADAYMAGPGGAGCEVSGGTLFASGTSFKGAHGGNGDTGASTFVPCAPGGNGGPGLLLLDGDPVVHLLDCETIGGEGGAQSMGLLGGDCADGDPGAAQEVLSGSINSIPVAARSFEVTSPVREGEPIDFVFAGIPAELYWFMFSLDQDPFYFAPFQGAAVPSDPYYMFVGAMPAGGTETITAPLHLPDGMEARVIYEQALYFTSATGFVLGEPRVSVVLDSSF